MRYTMKGGSAGCSSVNLPVDKTCKEIYIRIKGDNGMPQPYIMEPNGKFKKQLHESCSSTKLRINSPN